MHFFFQGHSLWPDSSCGGKGRGERRGEKGGGEREGGERRGGERRGKGRREGGREEGGDKGGRGVREWSCFLAQESCSCAVDVFNSTDKRTSISNSTVGTSGFGSVM